MEELLKQIVKNTSHKESYQLIVSGNTTEFTTKYSSPIKLNKDSKYEVALVNLETYHSFPNINSTNNVLKYSMDRGTNWLTITLPQGSYDVTDINKAVQMQMRHRNHWDGARNISYITISGNESTLRSELEISDTNYRVDFNVPNSLASVLGFAKKIYTPGYHVSENIVDILSINSILVEVNIINGSYVNNERAPVIYSFFPNVSPGYKIVEVPYNLVYLPVCVYDISSLTVRLTDQNGKLLNLRGETVTIRLHIREI